jgi:hypothetical protein
MRTSPNEIKEAESFLTNDMIAEDSLVFQARVITNPLLRLNVNLQSKLMEVVQLYHRRKLKRDLKSIHHELFTSIKKSDFQQLVQNIFRL